MCETIEGRPNLNVDWDAEYNKQRHNRLVDAIHEHMDDDISADVFMQTVLDTIRESAEYHQQRASVAKQYMDAVSSVIPS